MRSHDRWTRDNYYTGLSLKRLQTMLTHAALNEEAFPLDAEFAILAHGVDVETFRSDIAREYLEKHASSD